MAKVVGGNSAKKGRDKLKCARYRAERSREKNKKRRLAKHLRKHSTDRQAFHAHQNIFVGGA